MKRIKQLRRVYDRIVHFDEKSRAFPARAAIRSLALRSRTWTCYANLDQGVEGACHSDDTEVLTDTGWKLFSELEGSELLGTVDTNTGKLVFQQPTALQNYHYEGDMVAVDRRGLKFKVTPDHRMYVRRWSEERRTLVDEFQFVRADGIGWYAGLLAAPSGFDGTEVGNVVIDERAQATRGVREVNGDDLVSFMGIFMAEGCVCSDDCGNYRVDIAAVKPQTREKIRGMVAAMGHVVTSYPDRFTIHSKALLEFLAPYWNGGARNKYIPEWIKGATAPQLKLFIDAFVLGDGHTTEDGRVFLYTSSKKMADDLQEIYLKLGRRAAVRVREPRDACIDGRVIHKENCAPAYTVSPWIKSTLSIERKADVSTVSYSGRVYCATVPNGTLVTRLGGTVLISGNCAGFAVSHEAASTPAVVPGITNAVARQIYKQAQKLDECPGQDYDGTSVLAAMKAGKARGWWAGYRWAFGERDLAFALGYLGPAVLGVNWYAGMEKPDVAGQIHATGEIMGGHAILCIGYDAAKKLYRLHNSWGKDWGIDGDCFISSSDMVKLLSENGEAAIPMKRSVPK